MSEISNKKYQKQKPKEFYTGIDLHGNTIANARLSTPKNPTDDSAATLGMVKDAITLKNVNRPSKRFPYITPDVTMTISEFVEKLLYTPFVVEFQEAEILEVQLSSNKTVITFNQPCNLTVNLRMKIGNRTLQNNKALCKQHEPTNVYTAKGITNITWKFEHIVKTIDDYLLPIEITLPATTFNSESYDAITLDDFETVIDRVQLPLYMLLTNVETRNTNDDLTFDTEYDINNPIGKDNIISKGFTNNVWSSVDKLTTDNQYLYIDIPKKYLTKDYQHIQINVYDCRTEDELDRNLVIMEDTISLNEFVNNLSEGQLKDCTEDYGEFYRLSNYPILSPKFFYNFKNPMVRIEAYLIKN